MALKRVLINLLSAISFAQISSGSFCGFRVPPELGLCQFCVVGSVCIPAGQKCCNPRPRKSCPADRKTPAPPSHYINLRWWKGEFRSAGQVLHVSICALRGFEISDFLSSKIKPKSDYPLKTLYPRAFQTGLNRLIYYDFTTVE